MKKYKVYRSVAFQEEIAKYDKSIQDRIDKIEDKLMYNSDYGNPLGTRWFRESRFENYRIYYLIYEDLKLVLLVAVSGKKDQQATIDHIISQFKEYRKVAEQIAKQVS